jgi:hypothetical protein
VLEQLNGENRALPFASSGNSKSKKTISDPETDDTPKCCSCGPQAAYLGVIVLKNPRKQIILFDLKRAM